MKKIGNILSILLIGAILLAACGGAADAPIIEEPAASAEKEAEAVTEKVEETDSFKVAFVYVAPIGDLGWTWAQVLLLIAALPDHEPRA